MEKYTRNVFSHSATQLLVVHIHLLHLQKPNSVSGVLPSQSPSGCADYLKGLEGSEVY